MAQRDKFGAARLNFIAIFTTTPDITILERTEISQFSIMTALRRYDRFSFGDKDLKR